MVRLNTLPKEEIKSEMICPEKRSLKDPLEGFPGGTVVKNPTANAGDMGSSPGLGRFHMPWSN